MLKTSASAALASDKMQELESTLATEDGTWTFATLQQATGLLSEVRAMCRSQKLETILKRFQAGQSVAIYILAFK